MTVECLSAKMRDFCIVHQSIRVALTPKLNTHIKFDVPQYKWIWDLLCKLSHLIINHTPLQLCHAEGHAGCLQGSLHVVSLSFCPPTVSKPISGYESQPASRYLPLSIARYLHVYNKLKSRWAWRCLLMWKLKLPEHGLALRGNPQLVKWVWKYENLVSNID